MKRLLFFIAILFLTACKSKIVYVPLETVRIEYRDKVSRDSILMYDSVFLHLKGDTVWYEKHKFIYKDRLVYDSVFTTDSIPIPYPVVEIKEVNRLNSLQSFQIWSGRILLAALFAYFGLKIFARWR